MTFAKREQEIAELKVSGRLYVNENACFFLLSSTTGYTCISRICCYAIEKCMLNLVNFPEKMRFSVQAEER